MVGRLSIYAKNRILNLRFQMNSKIKHIAQTLLQEDNIKVSRESISTFLKKYIDTKSILDKPRSGRNKKLTKEEIELIGEVTRLNRDITAPKIKQYLNLNVSTHTILRASKLFEWNKNNPNSNQAKKAAAMERINNGEMVSRRRRSSRQTQNTNPNNEFDTITDSYQQDNNEEQKKDIPSLEAEALHPNLELMSEREILAIKNLSSSPMVFATKILMRIFNVNEMYGHNVSGKTYSKNIKNKKALDEKRIKYIRWLVENHYETQNRESQWKLCRTAINKIILINEKKSTKKNQDFISETKETWNGTDNLKDSMISCINLQPSNIYDESQHIESNLVQNYELTMPTQHDLNTSYPLNFDHLDSNYHPETFLQNKPNLVNKRQPKPKFTLSGNFCNKNTNENLNEEHNLNLIAEKDIFLLKNLYLSPMIFATKILLKIFDVSELWGHNLSGKTYSHSKSNSKKALDETRILYIRYLVEKNFEADDKEELWKSCRKAISRVLRNLDKKSNQVENVSKIDSSLISSGFNIEEQIKLGNNQAVNEESIRILESPDKSEINNKHTVVVLIDDPEQQRQMMLEQELEDSKNLEIQQQQETVCYQNLTTMTVLSLGSNY